VVVVSLPWTAGEDDTTAKQLLATGVHEKATVLDVLPEGGHIDDYGHIVVRYDSIKGIQIHEIWLDDYRDYDEGDTVTVVFDRLHPERVRTLQDKNMVPTSRQDWLADAAFVGVVLGLVGAGLCFSAYRRGANKRWDGRNPEAPDVVPSVGLPAVFEDPWPTAPRAWDDVQTVGAWRRYARQGLLYGGGAAVLFTVLGVGMHQVSEADAKHLAAWHRTRAVVYDGDWGGKYTQDWVGVRFEDDTGRTVKAKVYGPNPDEYASGEHLTVYYDPDSPGHVRTRAYTSHSNPVNSLGIVLGMAAAGAAFATAFVGVRSWRWRRWLRRGRWHEYRGSISTYSRWWMNEGITYLRVRGRTASGEPVDLVGRVSGELSDGFDHGRIVLCPGTFRRAVVASAPGGRPSQVRFPRSERQDGKWRGRERRGFRLEDYADDEA